MVYDWFVCCTHSSEQGNQAFMMELLLDDLLVQVQTGTKKGMILYPPYII